MAADQVEECWQLLRQSMRSVSYECLAHLPGYSAWLSRQDWTGAYQRHRRNLQLIGLPDRDRRWVLKNPSHLFALDALLRVYPDALVIQTHRAPRDAIASVCSLAAQASHGWSTTFRGPVIGRDQLELWARGLDEFTTARARYDPAQFCDVDYGEFVADPVGTVESAYAYFGLRLSGPAADAMRRLHAGQAGPDRPAHRYALSDFGLTGEQVDERFAGLIRAPADLAPGLGAPGMQAGLPRWPAARYPARVLALLPPGTVPVGAGLAILGAGSYAHLAVAGHTLPTAGMAEMSVLWSLVFLLGLGDVLPGRAGAHPAGGGAHRGRPRASARWSAAAPRWR